MLTICTAMQSAKSNSHGVAGDIVSATVFISNMTTTTLLMIDCHVLSPAPLHGSFQLSKSPQSSVLHIDGSPSGQIVIELPVVPSLACTQTNLKWCQQELTIKFALIFCPDHLHQRTEQIEYLSMTKPIDGTTMDNKLILLFVSSPIHLRLYLISVEPTHYKNILLRRWRRLSRSNICSYLPNLVYGLMNRWVSRCRSTQQQKVPRGTSWRFRWDNGG